MRRFVLSSREEPTDSSHSTSPQAEPDEVLQGLNPAQREAVEAVDGPVMIIAGAGSGKTRALTHRIAYLLAAEKAHPGQILALTFTNKAAREMRERVFDLVGKDGARGLWMGTFHSIFARLLRREGEKIGYTSNFSIYDQEDSKRLIRNIMNRYGMDTKRFKPRSMQSMISTAKNQLVSPTEYEQSAYGPYEERAAQLYQPYQETLQKSNAMDFDDLLVKPVELFQREADVLARYQERWQYIHIDEYQDTNRAQYRLARLLAETHSNLCVVGDDAQSIYSFRGADIRNILDFQNDFPEAKTVRLERNYRSTGNILQLADSVIAHNEDQIEKKLWTQNEPGAYITLLEAISEKDEARKISQNIQDLRIRKGLSYGGFAVLYRTNAQSRSLEEALRQQDIPYQIVGGVSFYQRKEIKDVLAYLKLLVNPDDAASLRRVINYPRRGIGDRTLEKITAFAQQEGISLWQAIERIEEVDALRTRQQNAVENFRSLIGGHTSRRGSVAPDELAQSLIKDTGMLKELRDENTSESLARWENVQELISAVAEFTDTADESRSLGDFLQEISLMTDVDNLEEEANQVTLMTLHGSKGLEFPVVFVTGLEEGLFPLARATEKREELEEERRLFYVGVTRAEQQLFLSHARSRYRYGQHQDCVKSRFLDEIDTSVVRTETGQKPKAKKGRFQLSDDGGGERTGDWNANAQFTPSSAPPSSDADESRRVVYDEGEGGDIVPGIRVEHDQFGSGKVVAVDGRGNRKKATVFFKGVGQKTLMLKYAGLRIVN